MEVIAPWVEIEEYDGVAIMQKIERACRTCYRSEGIITDTSYQNLLKNCISRGHESILEHEKITIRMCCDVGVYKDLTRHRTGTAFSIESTRYCNYSKDKFTNNIKFIHPIFIQDEENFKIWEAAMQSIEDNYMAMANNGAKPDELRMLLPHSTAAEVTMTCNIREWKHILELRCSKMVHPSVRQVMLPVLKRFKETMCEIFEDVPYDEDFPEDWYAQIN